MLKVTKEEIIELKNHNLLTQQIVTNKTHRSSQKTYYVTENRQILQYLGYYTQANCLEITEQQYTHLLKANLIIVQYQGTYIPHANCFISYSNQIFIIKEYKLLSYLGLLKA